MAKVKIAPPLRKERNNILRLISKRLKEVAVKEEDALADQITSTDDCRKMFRAAKQLCSMKPTLPIIVQDTDGNLMGTDKGKAKAIKDWFQQQFTDQQDEPLQLFNFLNISFHLLFHRVRKKSSYKTKQTLKMQTCSNCENKDEQWMNSPLSTLHDHIDWWWSLLSQNNGGVELHRRVAQACTIAYACADIWLQKLQEDEEN